MLALIQRGVAHNFITKKDFHGFIQAIVLQFDTNHQNILLLLGYRSPSCIKVAFDEFVDFLHDIFDEWNGQVIILGDFNFPTIDWEQMTHRGNISTLSSTSFLSLARSLGLKQMVDQPTHGLIVLDVLLTSQPRIIGKLRVLPPFST